MSIVQQELTIDDRYSQEIIQKARELSVGVTNYLVEQRYLLEVEEEILSPRWIRNKVLRMLLQELTELGIYFNRDVDDVMEDVVLHQAIIYLRSKFTTDTFFTFMQNKEELKDKVSELLGDDCIVSLISLMNETYPLDEGWEYLAGRGVIITSDQLFVDHVQAIFNKIDAYGEPSYESKYSLEQVNNYLQWLDKRNTMIEQLACSCFPVTAKDPNSSAIMTPDSQSQYSVKHYMLTYEKEMIRGENLYKSVSIFSDDQLTVDEKIGQIKELKKPYRRFWRHDILHWLVVDGKQFRSVLSDYLIALVVTSHYYPGMTSTQLRQSVEQSISDATGNVPEGENLIERMRVCMDRMMIPEEEVGTHETI